MDNIYKAPDSDLTTGEVHKLPFWMRWWQGRIKLWKAIVFLQLFGWLLLGMITTMSSMILPGIILGLFKIMVLLPFATYSSVVVWRASPKSRNSVTGVVVKLWSFIFWLYAMSVIYYLLVRV